MAFQVYYALGAARTKLEDWEGASHALKNGLKHHPNDAEAHHLLGLAYAHLDQLVLALMHLERAMILNPVQPKYRLSLGRTLGRTNQKSEAIEHLNYGLSLDPLDKVPFFLSLGITYREMGRLDASGRVLGRAHGIEPDNPDISNSLAVTRILQGEYESAAMLLTSILENHPERHDIRVNMVVAMVNLGNFNAARSELQHILHRIPDHVQARELWLMLPDLEYEDAP